MMILADIGGTNMRLAVVQDQHANATLEMIEIVSCQSFPTIEEVLASYLSRHNIRPDSLVLAVAADMQGDDVTITNNSWRFQGISAARACGVSRYMLINDFCAQALAHADLLMPCPMPAEAAGPDEITIQQSGQQSGHPSGHLSGRHIIRAGTARPQTPLLVSGPGTGLGVAALVPVGDDVTVIEGEGGHVSFAARNATEREILNVLQKRWGHVSAERVVSGPGLETIYHIMTGKGGRTAAEIGSAAVAGPGADRQAVDVLLTAFATVLANAALSFGAGAGIVIAGGIVPKLGALLPQSGFFDRLGDHGRRSGFLKALPLYLAVDPYAGCRGAFVAANTANLAHRWRGVR
jgi:glucokinase